MDAAAPVGDLYLRSAAAGDAIVPLGMSGTRKVSDILGEAGLTVPARRRLPIVCDVAGPIWLPGLCLGDRVKVTDATRQALELRFGPQSPDEVRYDAT